MQTTKKPVDPRHLEHFNQAMQKMSSVSLSYQQGKLKHMDYANQIDALIDASGWTREDFQTEIDRRSKKLGQK